MKIRNLNIERAMENRCIECGKDLQQKDIYTYEPSICKSCMELENE